MERFWVIPILVLIVGGAIAGGVIYEKYTVIIPKAEAELLELKVMTCSEIKTRNSISSYVLPTNGAFAREKIDACLSAENAIIQLERERVAKLLADPYSQESLEKKLLELIKLSDTNLPIMFEHRKQAQILEDKVNQFRKEINSTLWKMDDLGYLDNDGCIEMKRVNDIPMSTCK